MTQLPRALRFAAVAALAVSAIAFVPSPSTSAAPLPTGSLSANGDGGVVVDYTGEPETYLVVMFAAPATCPVGTEENPGDAAALAPALYGLFGFFAGPTPVTIGLGDEVNLMDGSAEVPLPAGIYQFCLVIYNGVAFVAVDGLEAEIGVIPEPSTTTTTAALEPTPATRVAPPVVTPRFTG